MARPLTYPGRVPPHSGILIGDRYLRVHPVVSAAMDRWPVDVDHEDIVLGRLLEKAGHAAVEELRPVVAVG
ncbi:hypothetical protein [Sphaerisporangium flaviroseum]